VVWEDDSVLGKLGVALSVEDPPQMVFGVVA